MKLLPNDVVGGWNYNDSTQVRFDQPEAPPETSIQFIGDTGFGYQISPES